MHTPAPRSLWLVPGRAPLTRGECGEDREEESRGGRGGPAGANPGRRVRGTGGGWRGRRPLLAWRKLPPMQMATVSTRWGGRVCGEGCLGPRDRAVARVGASVRVSVSVSECERSPGLTVTLAEPAMPGSLLRVPLLQQLSPRPARFLLTAPTARLLYRGSSAAPSPSLLRPLLAIAPYSPPPTRVPAPTTAESAGESRLGSPGTRGRHGGGGRGQAASRRLSSSGSDRTVRRLLALLGLQKPRAHPKEVFL